MYLFALFSPKAQTLLQTLNDFASSPLFFTVSLLPLVLLSGLLFHVSLLSLILSQTCHFHLSPPLFFPLAFLFTSSLSHHIVSLFLSKVPSLCHIQSKWFTVFVFLSFSC